jgi:CRP/FNR family transcriptional regulator, cyclic AMP receptor protein
MTLSEGVGWAAAVLVFSSFYLKTMMSLRLVAACSNVAFILYALSVSSTPILVLHTLLLPLNMYRLIQNLRLTKRVLDVSKSDAGKTLILPYMRRISLPAGSVLFTKGDPSDQIFYVVEGKVDLIGQCETRVHGELLGLLGVLTLGGTRLDTAISSTPVQLGVLSVAEMERILINDPPLNKFLLKTLAEMSHKYTLGNVRANPANGYSSPYTPQGVALH